MCRVVESPLCSSQEGLKPLWTPDPHRVPHCIPGCPEFGPASPAQPRRPPHQAALRDGERPFCPTRPTLQRQGAASILLLSPKDFRSRANGRQVLVKFSVSVPHPLPAAALEVQGDSEAQVDLKG